MLSSTTLSSPVKTIKQCVPFNFKPYLFATLLMAYSKTMVKAMAGCCEQSNGIGVSVRCGDFIN
jgi:hydrogenase-4 membrane subunit HyfE